MLTFIDKHRELHEVKPICRTLWITPCAHCDHLSKRADPARLSDRARRNEALRPETLRVFRPSMLPGSLGGEVHERHGRRGMIRGRPHRTTIPDKSAPCALTR